MRRLLGGVFILLGPIAIAPGLFIEGDVGVAVVLGGLALFLVGIALMAQRPSEAEVAEGMVRKDVVGSIIVIGALVAIVLLPALVLRIFS